MTIHRRRRSAAIGLTALSLTGGVAACGDQAHDTPMKVYADAQACQTAGQDWNTCNSSFQTAQAEHLSTAPRYASLEECRRATGGDCDEHAMSDGSSHVFLPLMAGFMLGQAMGGPRYVSHPIYYGQGGGLFSGRVQVAPRGAACGPQGGPGCANSGAGSWGGNGGSGSGGFARAFRSLPSEVEAPMTRSGGISSSRGIMRGGFGRAFGFHGGAGE